MLFDFAKIPHDQAYKLCVASVVPRPVAWVVSQDRAGQVNAAPFSFFNVFSDNPVVVAFGCGRSPSGAGTWRGFRPRRRGGDRRA